MGSFLFEEQVKPTILADPYPSEKDSRPSITTEVVKEEMKNEEEKKKKKEEERKNGSADGYSKNCEIKKRNKSKSKKRSKKVNVKKT